MITVIDFLTATSLWVSLATLVVFILLVPTFLYYLAKKKGARLLVSLVSIAILGVFIGMAQDVIFIKYMRDNLAESNQIQFSKNTDISVESLFQALLGIRTLKGKAGSHPTGGFEFTIIINSNEYEMRADKDSRDEGMYWVFYDGFPAGAQIGFIDLEQDSS